MIVNDSFLYVCEYGEINELNCLDVIHWPNHLRVIKVVKFKKDKFK